MTTSSLAIKPFGGAPGYEAQPFPIIREIPLIRAAFSMASSDQGDAGRKRRNVYPLVYATPLDGVIEHAEEGAKLRASGFQNPNERVRGVFGERASGNGFKDLAFDLKPSNSSNTHGPASYLLKISLPGSTKADWGKINEDAVQILIGQHQARLSSDKTEDIVALSVMIDPNKVDEDPGFGDFEEHKKTNKPYVATFQLPPYIDVEAMLAQTVEYPSGLKALDRVKGHLNIILPVTEDAQPRTLKLPSLGN